MANSTPTQLHVIDNELNCDQNMDVYSPLSGCNVTVDKQENNQNIDHVHVINCTDTKEQTNSPKQLNTGNKLHFVCYFFICIYWGNMSPLSGSLFSEIKDQLHFTTDLETSYIFISQQISFCISAIITAIITDKFINTHRWIALLLLIALVCLLFIPFIDSVYLMHVCWMAQGFAQGSIEVAMPVFIFRAFSNNDVWMVLLGVQSLSRTITPLIIQFSLNIFGEYLHSLLIVVSVGLVSCVFLVYLNTPKHDKYRSIKKQIEKSGCNKTPEQIKQEIKNSQGSGVKYGLIALFCCFWVLYAMIPNSMVNYISVYCEEHLKINRVLGRYLISIFYGGQFTYLFVTSMLRKKCETKQPNDKCTFLWLITVEFIFVLFGVGWICIAMVSLDLNFVLFALCVIFGSIGCILGFIYPTIYSLCESICPINGIISCMFTLSQGIGGSIILFVVGELIEKYGMHILPYPLTLTSIMLIIFTLLILCIHNKYKAHHKSIYINEENE